ncbi:MAG TPA: hypothetical protein VGN52_02610 [Burkholderiales bacterium]
MQDDDERMLRFHVLYSGLLKQPLDREEFDADDLYAFQALERAMRCENQELRNLAAHLQAQRQAAMESITLKAKDGLDTTRRLNTVAAPTPREAAETVHVARPVLPQQPAPPQGERRLGAPRLSPQEATRITTLERLYRLEFGRPLNVARFAVDDSYGRDVLKEALAASNQDLVVLARHYVDENGKPRRHRRGEQQLAAQ